MTVSSALPDVIDALVTALSSALPAAAVFDGPALSQTGKKQVVHVGIEDPYKEGLQPAGEEDQDWLAIGSRSRQGTLTVHNSLLTWDGGGTSKSVRDTARSMLNAVTDTITANPTLDGVVLWMHGPTRVSWQQAATTDGLVWLVMFDLQATVELS